MVNMKISKSNVRLIILSTFYILYLVVGASIFSAIEGPEERLKVKAVKKTRAKFLLDNKECMSDTELEAFIVEIIEANNRGVSAARNVSTEPNWSFGQSLFFAGTVLTTIGYGHVTPLSEGGKVFCIVYACIGIPLTLIMFTALVERLMILTGRMLQALHERWGHVYKALHIRLMHFSILLGILIVFFFLVPSAIFMFIEKRWNYLDAFYYCFISLTTIGLGDYIPGDEAEQRQRPLYKILTTFYLFVGLIFMMLTIANLYDIPELNLGAHFYMHGQEEEAETTRLRDDNSTTVPKYTEQANKGYQSTSAQEDDRQQLTDS